MPKTWRHSISITALYLPFKYDSEGRRKMLLDIDYLFPCISNIVKSAKPPSMCSKIWDQVEIGAQCCI